MSIKDLAEIAGYSTNYTRNLVYDKKKTTPRWMGIVVEFVKRLEIKRNKGNKV